MQKPILKTQKTIDLVFVKNNEIHNAPVELLDSSCFEENSNKDDDDFDFDPKYSNVDSINLESLFLILCKIENRKNLFLSLGCHPYYDGDYSTTLNIEGIFPLSEAEQEEAQKVFQKEMREYEEFQLEKKRKKEQKAFENKRKQFEKLKKELGE